jgi:hypothetical protein
MPAMGAVARRKALWRAAGSVPLLLAWAMPDSAWPEGVGGAVDRLWALLPALAYAGLAWNFARSLRMGQEPVIARYTRYDETRNTLECAGYARGLTLFWAVALGVAAVLGLAAAAAGVDLGYAPDAVLLALFLGEHVVRSLRFPAGGIAWPVQTLRAILRAERARHG